jgi:hypothetical protein
MWRLLETSMIDVPDAEGPMEPVHDTTAGALIAIKAFHSAVFLVMLSAICWLVATGITGRRDQSVAIAATLVGIESGVFLANAGVCPLTPLAERYGAARGGVSDIFLPDALARTIPIWATSLVVLGATLHVAGWARARTGAR